MTFWKDLNPIQREAVRTIEGPILIIAGAGSGKTRVLTYRVAYLLERGVPPSSILALTFTNKAAREMRERIARLVEEDAARKIWMGTFHAIFARLLRRDAEKIGFHRNFSIYDTEDSQNLIKTIMQDGGINTQQVPPAAVRHAVSRAKNRLISPADLANGARDVFERTVATVYEEYGVRLRNANAMDFDDLIVHPITLFDQHPDVLASYQSRFAFILIDEYQDTNPAQYEVIRRLAAARKNICVVGDDAQSIYAFRGADIRNILEFERDFSGSKVFRLEQNYRSTKRILLGAGALIRRNERQIAKNLWTDNPEGDPITIVEVADETEEARKIVAFMQEEGRKRKLQLKDFAVLYRTNAQSRAIEDAMRRHGIPYTIIGGVEFYRRKEVKDLLAYLRLVVNADDDEAFLRVVNLPPRGVGAGSVAKLRAYAAEQGVTLFVAALNAREVPFLSAVALRGLASFVDLIRKYASLRHRISAAELAGSLVDELGIIAEYKREGTPEARTRMENVQELLSAIADFRPSGENATLEAFLAEASLVADVDALDPNRNAVTLMTLHAAKGLEFPIVFITGMEEGLFPSAQAVENDEVEEERRLCYVGMTRAMQKLFLTYARSRTRWGERLRQVPSRFLEEVDPSAVVHESMRRATSQGRLGFSQGRMRSTVRRGSGHDHGCEEGMPEYWSQIDDGIAPGRFVVHPTFGRGRVVDVQGAGDSARAVVLFETVGRKTLVLKYAGLHLL
ncbi:MAG: UvrD-helicase domain-containing protein [Bacteroidota bacterium]|nr:UvrD-helicase domain-containing protein [Bacteroidota bacterium]